MKISSHMATPLSSQSMYFARLMRITIAPLTSGNSLLLYRWRREESWRISWSGHSACTIWMAMATSPAQKCLRLFRLSTRWLALSWRCLKTRVHQRSARTRFSVRWIKTPTASSRWASSSKVRRGTRRLSGFCSAIPVGWELLRVQSETNCCIFFREDRYFSIYFWWFVSLKVQTGRKGVFWACFFSLEWAFSGNILYYSSLHLGQWLSMWWVATIVTNTLQTAAHYLALVFLGHATCSVKLPFFSFSLFYAVDIRLSPLQTEVCNGCVTYTRIGERMEWKFIAPLARRPRGSTGDQ